MSAIPYIKFFPSDWLSEESLRLVSPAARGVWIDLICLMAKNERRGYLELNGGVNPTLPQLGRLVGLSAQEIGPLIDELKHAGTCSIDAKGVLFCRRLVRDTEAYEQAVTYGKQGGNPRLRRGLKAKVKAPLNPNGQPPLGSGFWIMASGFSDSFKMVWQDYTAYRTERKLPPFTSKGEAALAKRLTEWGERRATAAIEFSMSQNWQGIFEQSNGSRPNSSGPEPKYHEV